MCPPRELKIHAVQALFEAELDARLDEAEGFEPETAEEQWESAVELLQEQHGELLLIALMNAGWVRGIPTESEEDPWNLVHPDYPTWRYGGLTEEGRALADQRRNAARN